MERSQGRRGAGPLLAVVVVVSSVLAGVACEAPDSAASPSISSTPSSTPSSSPSLTPLAAGVVNACHRGGVVYCALNPAVTKATIRRTICVSGWTATIRPSTSYTTPLKLRQMASEHLLGPASAYEEDHRVPLELGGAPRDPSNLSPEAHPGSYGKDAAENAARSQVCRGASLRTVQAAFVARWLAPYPRYR